MRFRIKEVPKSVDELYEAFYEAVVEIHKNKSKTSGNDYSWWRSRYHEWISINDRSTGSFKLKHECGLMWDDLWAKYKEEIQKNVKPSKNTVKEKVITFYKNNKDSVGKDILLQEALIWIEQERSIEIQEKIRATTDKKERNKLKGQLPAVTWSGRFNEFFNLISKYKEDGIEKESVILSRVSVEECLKKRMELQQEGSEAKYFVQGRKKDLLAEHSGIICLDIDDVEHIDILLTKVHTDDHTIAYFISPSGNGVKVLYAVKDNGSPITWQRHEELWAGMAEYFFEKFGLSADESGKDVSRLCYLPADADINISGMNIEDDAFTSAELDEYREKRKKRLTASKLDPSRKNVKTEPAKEASPDVMERLYRFTSNKIAFTEGNRNNFIHLFANNANRWGVDRNEVLSYWAAKGYGPDDIAHATIVNLYARNVSQFGQYKKSDTVGNTRRYSNIAGVDKDEDSEEFDDEVEFWFETENEKTGKVEVKFSYDNCVEFLTRNGFFKYAVGSNYDLIHVNGRIVTIINERKIREFMFRFLKGRDDLRAVREMMRRGAKTYLSTHLFEQLEYLDPEMKRDTKEECYIYFTNCYLKVTPSSVEKKDYETLDGCIWSKQIIDFKYEDADYTESDFFRFLNLSMNGYYLSADGVTFESQEDKKEVTEEEIEVAKVRMKSIASGIGYLLHGWKDPSKAKAFIAVDRAKSRAGEPNGRTGKSLLAKAISKILPVCTIPGPNFKFDKEFSFQRVESDTRLINFNDVTPNFDFNRLFSFITEEFTYEKKRMDEISIPFKDSPKFYISTNFTLKGDGDSNVGRQFVVEFGNYFTADRTPVTVFGRRFFDEWEQMEYCRFYSFMLHCVKIFLKNGLVDFPLESYAERKLVNEAGEEFLIWMDEIVTFIDDSHKSSEFEKKKLLAEFRERSGLEKTSPNKFHKFLIDYAALRGLEINKHMGKSGRDRRGGVDYITFYKS